MQRQHRPIGVLLVAATLATVGTSADQSDDTHPTLTLESAVALALEGSPLLKAQQHVQRALMAEAQQAGLRPNPELEGEVENIAGNGPFGGTDSAEYTIALTQTLERGGKRAKRQRVAQLDSAMADWTVAELRRSIQADVTMAAIDFLANRARVDLTATMKRLAQEIVDTAQKRVTAGGASAMELAKAQIEQAIQDGEHMQATQALATSRRNLASAVGLEPDQQLELSGSLPPLQPLPDIETLRQQLTNHPAYAQSETAREHGQAAVAMATAERLPDLDWRVGWRQDDGESAHAFLVGISMPIPLFNRQQGQRAATDHRLAATEFEQQAVGRRLDRELSDAYSQLVQAHASCTTLEQVIAPAAERAFELSQQGYEQGRFSHLDLLDAQHTLFAVRGRAIESRRDYHQAGAIIEQLTAAPIHFNPTTTKD